MIVCLQLTAVGKRVAFNVTVDTYTALKANGVYAQMKTQSNASLTLQFKNVSMTSGYLLNDKVAQLYSFVIRTDNGVVTGIESDNAAYANAGCVDSTAMTFEADTNCFGSINSADSGKVSINHS